MYKNNIGQCLPTIFNENGYHNLIIIVRCDLSVIQLTIYNNYFSSNGVGQ